MIISLGLLVAIILVLGALAFAMRKLPTPVAAEAMTAETPASAAAAPPGTAAGAAAAPVTPALGRLARARSVAGSWLLFLLAALALVGVGAAGWWWPEFPATIEGQAWVTKMRFFEHPQHDLVLQTLGLILAVLIIATIGRGFRSGTRSAGSPLPSGRLSGRLFTVSALLTLAFLLGWQMGIVQTVQSWVMRGHTPGMIEYTDYVLGQWGALAVMSCFLIGALWVSATDPAKGARRAKIGLGFALFLLAVVPILGSFGREGSTSSGPAAAQTISLCEPNDPGRIGHCPISDGAKAVIYPVRPFAANQYRLCLTSSNPRMQWERRGDVIEVKMPKGAGDTVVSYLPKAGGCPSEL